MREVFLVQSISTASFRNLAKAGFKVRIFDCATLVCTYYACRDKREAVNDCRKHNRDDADKRYFVNVISLV